MSNEIASKRTAYGVAFGIIDEVTPPVGHIGQTVEVLTSTYKQATITSVKMHKCKDGRRTVWTWFYTLDIEGVSVCRWDTASCAVLFRIVE